MIDRRRVLTGGALSLAASTGPRPSLAAPAEGGGAPRLRRGVNIHHMLNWPMHLHEQPLEYAWPPFATPAYATGADTLAALRRAGFTFVRLTLDPAIFMASDGRRRQMLVSIVLERVRQLLGAGFEVILDLHPVAENPAYAPAKLTMVGFADFPAYLETVTLLAAALHGLPPTMVALELMNEPQLLGPEGLARWRQLLQSLYAAARTAAPDLALVLTGANWSAARELTLLDTAPFRGGNVIYAFHHYDPHIFTHQGMAKATPEKYFEGLLWPPQVSQAGRMTNLLHQRIAADPAVARDAQVATFDRAELALARYMTIGDGERKIREDFALVALWARANGVPADRILLGEFGANEASAETPAQHGSRIAWLAAVRKAAEAQGFGWAYWALEDVSASRGGFRLLPAGSATDFESGVLHALFD